MTNTAKKKGARSEWKVRDHYEKRGWYVVKAGGSLGLFDLICLHPDHTDDLVQVKTNRNIGREERERIQNFQVGNRRKILAIVRDYQRTIEFYDL